MFVISWRNPDARHAAWDLDTYVQAVLDALDAVEEITGSARTVLGGVCSGGILASMAAAYLAAHRPAGPAGRVRLAVTVLDTDDAGTRGALVDERPGAAAKAKSGAQGLPRRPDAGRGVRVAAARRPGLELLGQQLPARQASRRRSTSCSGTPTPPG